MITLALDCHSKTCSVAILKDDMLLYESIYCSTATHSEALLKICDDAFKTTSLTPADVNLFGITNGPGSFTGLRIGLCLIKSMAFVNNTPCVGVSSLKYLANTLPVEGYVAAAIDARRDEIYCALFERKNGKLTQIIDDCSLNCIDFENAIKKTRPDACKIIAIGDGAKKLSESTDIFTVCDNNYIMGRACSLGTLVLDDYKNNLAINHSELLPSYLKLSQAEQQRALQAQQNL